MTTLKVSIAPAADVLVPAGQGPFFLDAIYLRVLESETNSDLSDLPNVVQDTVRAVLDDQLRGSLDLLDVAPSTNIDLCFLSGNGAVRLRKQVAQGEGDTLAVELAKEDVAAITTAEPQPDPRIFRRAFFVPVTDQRVPFESSKLQIALIKVGSNGWTGLGLDQLFYSDLPITTSVQWNGGLPSGLGTLAWVPFPLAVDGQFSFSFPVNSGDAWLWWLSGPLSALGVVLDDLAATRVVRIGVGLPAFSGPVPSTDGKRPPFDVTEAQVSANPGLYTEDPGEFCRPFSNPERVLGERSFFVILRAEQPVISAEATVRKDPLPVITHLATVALPSGSATPVPANLPAPGGEAPETPAGTAAPIITGDVHLPEQGTLYDGSLETKFVRHTIPTAYSNVLARTARGRVEMDAAHPMQWEGDSIRYQATTVVRGHILEFRMRWRSNGYSLGTVAKTLTLAPRQTRRIQKVEWRRAEASRRTETTRLFDQVSDTVSRDRTYEDEVQANLSEWARGESESSSSAGAGGFGFATAGFVIGGGGGGSNAESSSSQEGGRRTSASEEQHLRDTIRRYGDALRKLDSMVVNEVTQEESVVGTTEFVRNQNYGHSLTVIYYQILRHLKIETAVAGVRECLFVPFAISPFTVERAYRWREQIQAGLRDPRYGKSIQYLRDVRDKFENSEVPIGKRSEQPVRYIYGSLFLKLGIERPKDKDDGAFDAATWAIVRPYLGSPALSIYTRLKEIVEAQRDAVFQQQHAGVIAAAWVNTLTMSAGATPIPLRVDFTLATRYQFNNVVRVDFSIQAPSGVTRELLGTLCVQAGKDLPPGSVANLQSLTFTYATDQFERTVSASQGSGDLVDVESGVRDPSGATIGTIPDLWERTDVRSEMTRAVNDLLEHLNQHVEYYTKLLFWRMDRDRLWMMIDGFYVPGTNQISIASVVERDPIAIIGNALVYRVSAGSFLGIGDIKTPAQLLNHYISLEAPSEPMLVSLPTDGLYAQTIMDECAALEEHFGNTDWVLDDPDPALGEIAPELLGSRRTEPADTTPSQLPATIINLQNAPEAPAPSGLAGALSAVTNANAFRDMAGLAGTQANAAAALQTAANLATNFGNQAAALKLAEIAKDAQNTQTADKKVATIQRARDKQLVTDEDAQAHTSKVLDQLHESSSDSPGNQREAAVTRAVFAASASGQPFTVQHTTANGQTTVNGGGAGSGGGSGTVAIQPFAEQAYGPQMVKDVARTKDLTDAIQNVRNDPILTPANQQRLNLDQLAIVIAKLGTDHNPVEYAGVRDDLMFFSGSLLKVALLYASYELRARLNALAPTVTWDWNPFFSAVRSAVPLIPNGQEREMNIDEILKITATTDAGVLSFDLADDHLKDLKAIVSNQNSNVAPKKVMHRLGYSYVNGALAAAGFFNGRTGIWLANDFPPNQWRQFHVPVATGGKSSEAMTAVDMANLLTCMHRGTLIDKTSSDEMMDIMKTGGSWASFLTDAERASLSFTTRGAKVGHDPSADARVDTVKSEGVFLDRGGVPFVAVWQNFPDAGPSVAANLLRVYKIIDEVVKKWP